MSDEELRRRYAASSQNGRDIAVRALLREIERRSLPVSNTRKHQPWTGDDDAELLRLRRDGKPIRDIAAQIGRTQAATDARLTRLKRMGRV